MQLEMLPFVLGFAAGFACCIAAIAVIMRALKPFTKKQNTIKLQLQNINIDQARKDAIRLAEATTKIAQLRASLGG